MIGTVLIVGTLIGAAVMAVSFASHDRPDKNLEYLEQRGVVRLHRGGAYNKTMSGTFVSNGGFTTYAYGVSPKDTVKHLRRLYENHLMNNSDDLLATLR